MGGGWGQTKKRDGKQITCVRKTRERLLQMHFFSQFLRLPLAFFFRAEFVVRVILRLLIPFSRFLFDTRGKANSFPCHWTHRPSDPSFGFSARSATPTSSGCEMRVNSSSLSPPSPPFFSLLLSLFFSSTPCHVSYTPVASYESYWDILNTKTNVKICSPEAWVHSIDKKYICSTYDYIFFHIYLLFGICIYFGSLMINSN